MYPFRKWTFRMPPRRPDLRSKVLFASSMSLKTTVLQMIGSATISIDSQALATLSLRPFNILTDLVGTDTWTITSTGTLSSVAKILAVSSTAGQGGALFIEKQGGRVMELVGQGVGGSIEGQGSRIDPEGQ